MTTEEQTIEQRIVELESAIVIAEGHSDLLFARKLRDELVWLRSIQERDQHAV